MSAHDETLAELEARIIELCWGGELARQAAARRPERLGDCLSEDLGERDQFLSYRAQRLLEEEALGSDGASGGDAGGRNRQDREAQRHRPQDPMELPYLNTGLP